MAFAITLGIGGPSGPTSVSSTSSALAAPEPTPTYVSELGPAVTLPPNAPELPLAGAGFVAHAALPKALGLGVALLGALMMRAALAVRSHGSA